MFREYAPRIYHIARRMLGNDADAEDVTQDVLLQVVRKLDTFRGDAQLSTWLHRVTVNAALAHRQKRANRQKRETARRPTTSLETAAAGRPGEAVERRRRTSRCWRPSRHELIEKAIEELPEPFRDVYVLADVEGLPNAEIGGDAGAERAGGEEPAAPGPAADAGRAGPALRGGGRVVS